MTGKLVASGIVLAALIGGAAMWYLQVYGYYREVALGQGGLKDGLTTIQLVDAAGEYVALDPKAFQGITSDSSPIRFRGCMTLDDPEAAIAMAPPAKDAEPLVAPFWFDCFDAVAIGGDLEAGRATAIMAEENIEDGIDRVLAIYPDGRAFAWHQLNATFRK
ncbi:MAG: histidine kinase [Rhodobacteraceae bacterium]|nr:histidine kinase [Paracoccaceae bacterium]